MKIREHFSTIARSIAWGLIAVAAPAAFGAAPHVGAPDPIEGKWWGKAGFPQDRIDLGFEFRRNEKGEIKVFIYEPVENFYSFEAPGVLVRTGDRYVDPDWAIDLTRKGDTLTGTYLPLKAPAELHRTEILPIEPPIPDVPKGPGPKWIAKLGGQIFAAAAVRDGVAYIGTSAGVFYAIHVEDGSFLWNFIAGRPVYGEALATESNIFFVCDNGYLFNLDRKSGKEVWRYDLGDGRVSRPTLHQLFPFIGAAEFDCDVRSPKPLIVDGVLYVGSGDGSFHAVDAATGNRVWRFENPDAAKPSGTPWDSQTFAKNRATAAIDGDRIFFGSFDQHMYALDRKSGALLWDKNTGGELTTVPAVIGGKLLIGNRAGLVAALDPATGKTLWRMTFWGSAIESSPVDVGDGLFVIGASDLRRVSLIDSRDGRVVWRTDVYGVAWATPAIDSEHVFASAWGIHPYNMRHVGGFSAIDRKTGALLWRWPAPEDEYSVDWGFVAGPAVAGNLVLAGALDGNLYAFPVE